VIAISSAFAIGLVYTKGSEAKRMNIVADSRILYTVTQIKTLER